MHFNIHCFHCLCYLAFFIFVISIVYFFLSLQKPLLEVEFQTCIRCRGWPLSLEGDKIVVRLGEIEPSLLRTGDYYVFVRPTYPGAELVLKYCKPHSSSSKVSSSNCLKEHVIRDSEFGKVFSMEGPNMGPSTLMTDALSDEQMTALLQHMLVSVEKGIKRMNWELQQTSQQWAKMIPPSSITECLSLTSRSSMDTLCSQSSCCCCGLHSVDVKDSGVQTSPTDEHKDGSSFPTLSSSSSSLSPAGVKNDKLSSTLRSTSSCGSSGIDDDLCNSVPDGNDGDNKESTILKYSKDCVLQTSSVLPESKISMTKQAEDTKMMSSCGQTDSSINLTSSPLVESANQGKQYLIFILAVAFKKRAIDI